MQDDTVKTKQKHRSMALCKAELPASLQIAYCFYQFYCVHFRDAHNSSADYVIERTSSPSSSAGLVTQWETDYFPRDRLKQTS